MSHGAPSGFQAPVAESGTDLRETFHNAMPHMTDGARFVTATFSGGCLWCLQPPFDILDGVVATVIGYTGGCKTHPSYEDVIAGRTGHALAVQVLYDPRRLSYSQLLDVFWHNIDPTVPNRQFCARGVQYRAAIFYHDETQKHLAEASKQALASSQRFAERIAIRIAPLGTFYQAEACHQHCYRTHPQRYRLCRAACNRDQRLLELWGALPPGAGDGHAWDHRATQGE
jgi:peptide-methionine (S)-S-oxide reductase